MTTPHTVLNQNSESIWILIGVAVGAVGGWFCGDGGFGTSIGMMIGAVITMILERKRNKKNYSVLLIAVSVTAVVLMIAFRVIEGM